MHCYPFCRPSVPKYDVGLLWLAVVVATVGSLLPRVSHKASATLTIAVTVLWSSAPALSLMEGGSLIINMERKRPSSGLTLLGSSCSS